MNRRADGLRLHEAGRTRRGRRREALDLQRSVEQLAASQAVPHEATLGLDQAATVAVALRAGSEPEVSVDQDGGELGHARHGTSSRRP